MNEDMPWLDCFPEDGRSSGYGPAPAFRPPKPSRARAMGFFGKAVIFGADIGHMANPAFIDATVIPHLVIITDIQRSVSATASKKAATAASKAADFAECCGQVAQSQFVMAVESKFAIPGAAAAAVTAAKYAMFAADTAAAWYAACLSQAQPTTSPSPKQDPSRCPPSVAPEEHVNSTRDLALSVAEAQNVTMERTQDFIHTGSAVPCVAGGEQVAQRSSAWKRRQRRKSARMKKAACAHDGKAERARKRLAKVRDWRLCPDGDDAAAAALAAVTAAESAHAAVQFLYTQPEIALAVRVARAATQALRAAVCADAAAQRGSVFKRSARDLGSMHQIWSWQQTQEHMTILLHKCAGRLP